MKRAIVALVGLSLIGCRSQADLFRSGLPTAEMVNLDTPANGQALTQGVVQQGLSTQGQRADMYNLTRAVTVGVNLSTLVVLFLLHEVVKHNPTTIGQDSATWGPYGGTSIGDGLQPKANTWKLTVSKTAEANTYSYELRAKASDAPDSAYVVILSGSHTQSVDNRGEPIDNFGSGNFTIDWDKAQTLPDHGLEVGTATFSYSRVDASAVVSVNVDFHQVRDWDNSGRLSDGAYKYTHTPGNGGTFEFKVQKPASPSPEMWNIKSRWMQSGTGRSDARVTGGALSIEANGTECWDTNFNSRYQYASYDSSRNYGNEGTDCPFTAPEYSSL